MDINQALSHRVISELLTCKKDLKRLSKTIDNKVVAIKLNQISEECVKLTETRNLKDSHVLTLMRIYDLIRECKNVVK